MEQMLLYDRLQFAVTISFHYLFPQLTMGLALMLLYFRSRAVWGSNRERYEEAARFWTRVFAVTFAFGVVTGIPMEFQFGTNWAAFSRFAGGVIGQTLAIEGVFAFFLESAFLGIMLFGGKRFGPKVQWFATLMVFFGTWLSGYFIIATNAWMQHPVAYSVAADGSVHVNSLWGLLTNPWLPWQYLHNQTAAVATGSFVVAGVGAYALLTSRHAEAGRLYLRTGVVAAAIATPLLIFPTGDQNALAVFHHQPVKGAAMEALFETSDRAAMALFGEPNMNERTIDNPIIVPDLLTFLIYHRFRGTARGLESFPQAEWPDNVPLVYYAYHLMITLGSLFAGLMVLSALMLWRRKLYTSRWMLWIIVLASPLPYVSTTAGWMTAEVGRQPWLVYGVLRTADGLSHQVSAGSALFSFLGFLTIYVLLAGLYLVLMLALIRRGLQTAPANAGDSPSGEA